MTCKRCREWLRQRPEYVAQEYRTAVGEHIRSCPECQEWLAKKAGGKPSPDSEAAKLAERLHEEDHKSGE